MKIVRPVAVTETTLTSTSVAETVALYNSATTYGAGDTAYRVISGQHVEFSSISGGNVGHTPEESPTYWVELGATNRFAMFDDTSDTQTSDTDEIVVEITLPATERADVVWLSGLDAKTVRIEVEDPTAGPVYDETFSLADFGAITDLYSWLFDPVRYVAEKLFADLPNGAGSTFTITISNPGATAKCGNLVLGYRKRLGDTEWGVKTETRDYSNFVEDEVTGSRRFVRRAYRKLATARAILDNRAKDGVERELIDARAAVRLYILSEAYSTLCIFGTAKWSVDMDRGHRLSTCTLQLEGNT